MGKIILNRDTNTENGVNLRIQLPLTTNGDITVDERGVLKVNQKCEVACKSGVLIIEIEDKLKKGDYSRLIAKVYADKGVRKIFEQQAQVESDKVRRTQMELYNEFRLTWIGLCLNDEQRCSETVLPTALGSNTFFEEIDTLIQILSNNVNNSTTKSSLKATSKALTALGVEVGGIVGTGAAITAGAGAVAVGVEAGATAASMAGVFGVGTAGAAASAVTTGVAAAGLAGVAAVAAVPVALVAGPMIVGKLAASANKDIMDGVIDAIFFYLTLPNVAKYLQDNDLKGVTAFRELANMSNVLGGKKLYEMEDEIVNFI